MFERAHHLRIAAVLGALDGPTLSTHRCYFGGGTAIVLRYGEYRESADIDFLVSDPAGYRELRELLTTGQLQAIARHGVIQQTREIRADQYGIRTWIEVGGTPIKFEIVREARIQLELPHARDEICGITTLSALDLAATKLLANSDRWADAVVCHRDIIDLAMMRPSKTLFARALGKARAAYGRSVDRDLLRAFDAIQTNPQRLDECMSRMRMTSVPKALLWSHLERLAKYVD